MKTYCVSCKKNTVNKNSSVRKFLKSSVMLLPNCIVSGKKKLTFIRNQELHEGIFINLNNISSDYFNMNKIIDKLFTVLVDHLTNIVKKIRKTGNVKHLYRNKLDKACFPHDAAYSHSKDLTKGTNSNKVFKEKAIEIARNHKYDGYQRALASMF